MDPVTLIAVVATIVAAASSGGSAWLQARVRRQRAREQARGAQLRELPPGSRVIDLGEHGIVIDVGGGRAVQTDHNAGR
jgi:preprotein translocase subunit YajC